MVWVGSDLEDCLVPAPCPGQGHLPPDQGAQSPVQPGLEEMLYIKGEKPPKLVYQYNSVLDLQKLKIESGGK